MLQDISTIKCIMKETTRYDNVHRRPFVTNYDGEIAEAMRQATDSGTRTTVDALSSVAGSFLQPSSVPGGIANIDNGFSEKRFSFMMEFKEQSQLGSGMRYILSGYSDYLGASRMTGNIHLDPNMKLYINNIFTIRDTQMRTANSNNTIQSNMVDGLHVLHNPNCNDYMRQVQPVYTQRPEDVYAKIAFNNDDIMNYAQQCNLTDDRNVVTEISTASRRHESRPRYLSDSINAYQTASHDDGSYMSEDSNIWDNARDKVREKPVNSNRLMQLIQARSSLMSVGYVTYSELCSIVPDLDSKNTVLYNTPVQEAKEYQPGQGESWGVVSQEAIAATIIQQTVPSLMSDALIVGFGFKATNNTITGEHVITPYLVNSFTENLNMEPYVRYLLDRLRREVLDDISKGGQIAYSVDCRMDMMYDSHIVISLNGEPDVYFAAPSFCDGLYTPIITDDPSGTGGMSGDIESMLLNLSGDTMRMANDSQIMDSQGQPMQPIQQQQPMQQQPQQQGFQDTQFNSGSNSPIDSIL